MGDSEDDVVVVAIDQAADLPLEPAFDRVQRAQRAGPMVAGVIDRLVHVPVRAGADMVSARRRPARLNGCCRLAHMKRLALCPVVRREMLLKNLLND